MTAGLNVRINAGIRTKNISAINQMKGISMEEKCKIICGDALEILNTLPDESVDCVMTSPPYWSLRDYKTKDIIWDGEKDCEHSWNIEITKLPNASGGQGEASKVQSGNRGSNFADYNKRETRSAFCIKCHAWKGSLGLEPTFELYIKHLCDIFDEVKRILKKTGTVWVNLGDTYSAIRWSESAGTSFMAKSNPENIYGEVFAKNTGLPDKSLCNIPARFSIEMQKRGWILRQDIIWSKPNPMPESVTDRCTKSHEYIFFLVKSPKYFYDNEAIKEKAKEDSGWDKSRKDGKFYLKTTGFSKESQTGKGLTKFESDGTRNKRSVWSIMNKPFSEAHFAVFPEELPENCIKAGCPEFVCNKCGKPREKIYEREGLPRNREIGKQVNIGQQDGRSNMSGDKLKQWKEEHPDKFIGLSYCKCNAGFSGGVVLDMFMGSGTSGLVAMRQGKKFIGIELNPKYIEIAERRLHIEKDKTNINDFLK